jgi:DNA replication protein DnaC
VNDFNPDPADPQRRAADQAEVRLARIDMRLDTFRSRRPAAFADDGALRTEVTSWLDAYRHGATGSLVLWGDVGTGKTWTTWKAIETLISDGWSGRWAVVEAYELKRAADLPVDRDALDTWAGADLLVLDDIGSIRINDWDADALFSLIDQRWKHRRPVIVTGNEANLRQLLGERAASRLADGATAVQFDGNDHRRDH